MKVTIQMFDNKIRTYVSANSGDTYSHLQIHRETRPP